jgi:outer membrane lipoprotein carrier protein
VKLVGGWHSAARWLGGITTLLSLVMSAAGQAGSVAAVAQAVDGHYNRLHTLRADFTEVYRGAGLERTETGVLWLKKPGKMRWEYRSPKEKLFVSDGRDAWFYIPGDRQVRRTQVKKIDDLRSPLAFLLGKTKLEKELQPLSLAPDVTPIEPGDTVLRGVPREMSDRVREVLLEITPQQQIRRLVIEEVDGAVTEYVFRDIQEDIAVGEDRFSFSPPPGVETITGDVGQ